MSFERFKMQEWVLWMVSSITVFGSILNVKKKSSCFLVWTLCNIFWLIYDLYSRSYARSVLDVVNLATSIWGMLSWIKPKEKSDHIPEENV